jgi:hypothetical protein
VNGKVVFEKVKEECNGWMEHHMLEIGKIIILMGLVNSNFQTMIYTKAILGKVKGKVKASFSVQAIISKVCGRMT